MKHFFTSILCLLIILAGKAQNSSVMKQVVVAEYFTWYITQDGKIWAYNNNSALPVQFPIGGLKADTGAGGFNYFRILDEQGYVWTNTGAYVTTTARIDTDTTGAPFGGNWYIDAYGHATLTIRADSSVWFFGRDIYSLFYPGGSYFSMTGTAMKPTRMSPAGMKFRKVLFGGTTILGLTTTGQVYQWNAGSKTPTLIPTVRPATDIFISHLNAAGCIIPDAGENSGMGYPYIWGGASSMWGGTNSTTPVSIKALWNMTVPIKEISMDWNTIHYIDSLGNMYGCGFNSFGEVGNGQEFIGKYNYPGWPNYGWDLVDYENPSGIPVQIGKGIKWKHIYSNNWFGFYKYAMDVNDSIYSWGRNKSLVLGNGLWNGYNGGQYHPNTLDVLKPTMVHPLASIFTEYDYEPPTMTMDPNRTISTSTATLTGKAKPLLCVAVKKPAPNGIDTVGYKIVSYLWTKVSGPAGGTIASPNAASTSVSGLTTGTYIFNLLATDNNTGTISGNDTIVVTSTAPGTITVNAGANQTITQPASSVTLTGSASVVNGTISSYKWSQISGPSTSTITSAGLAQTTVTGLIQGVYTFQLLVTTALSTTATATVQVTVNAAAAPGPPTVNAGTNQTITLPTSSATLTGTASETNGTITTYAWSQVGGPSAATIATAAQAQTTVSGLAAGTYVFQLKVTDNSGVTATAQVNVTVNASSGNTGSTYQSVPGTIQAESYSSMLGVATETTTDAGGGLDVGWIGLGDWMSYNVNVASAGTYTVNFRVSSALTGASFKMQDANGNVLTTVNVPNTGGWPTWTTLSATVTLPAGTQTLTIVSLSANGFNFNWMQFALQVTAPSGKVIPGTIQAEDYDAMIGVSTETTKDTGGGLDVNYLNYPGNQVSYNVTVSAAGTYTATFRVASPNTGASFKVMDGNNNVLATVTAPNTGGWQVWGNVSASVTLPAGAQTIKVVCQSTSGFNFNWMQFVTSTTTAVARNVTASSAISGISVDATDSTATGQLAHFNLYPNPAIDQVTLDIANSFMGRLDVQVISVTGMVVRRYELNKGLAFIQTPISLSGLIPGMYIVRVSGTGWYLTKKVLKQ